MAMMDDSRDFELNLLRRAKDASMRWEARSAIRKQRSDAVAAGQPLQSDSPERLAMRINNLISNVRRASQRRRPPSDDRLRKLIARRTAVTAAELNDDMIKEVVNGARNFLSIEFLEGGLRVAKSVGRILISTSQGPRARGTGFLVAPGLMMTNHHVLPTAAIAATCLLQMDYEGGSIGPLPQPETFSCQPATFFINDKDLDFALVGVAAKGARGRALEQYGWITLDAAQGKIAVMPEDYLNIVQHPGGREKEIVVRENRALDLLTAPEGADSIGPFIHYEADTEKGSSGSPVFSDQWAVVALHHSGVPAKDELGRWLNREGKFWVEGKHPVSEISWVGNEGTRVSSLIAALTDAKVRPHEEALLRRFLSAQPPLSLATQSEAQEEEGGGAGDGAQTRAASPARITSVMRADGTMDVDIPIRISVQVGGAILQTPQSMPEVASVRHRGTIQSEPLAADELLQEKLQPEDLADREGFDQNFLGVPVPMPAAKSRMRFGSLLRVPRPARDGDVHELRYINYSVLMNAERRLAYVSACNIDFGSVNASRDDGRTNFRLDPRLDNKQQVGGTYYSGAENLYDQGHLTRRDDAAWGEDLAAAVAANDDTYFYTNAAPQHYLANRSTRFTRRCLDLWGDLEDVIAEQGTKQREKLVVFNGPVFTLNDKPLRDILVPLSFFKIVVWQDQDQDPGALGFVIKQDDLIAELPEEAIDPGRLVIRQRKISAIEAMLDISFGPVQAWDRFKGRIKAKTAQESADDDDVVISRSSDLQL